ncbi:MAG: glycosyltransferase family 4 protein [Mesorhizobium sp.]
MSATIWYISKYAVVPMAQSVGTRAFMLMRELARKGHRCLILTSDSNHLVTSPEFEGSSETLTVDGVDVCWVRTMKYQGAKSIRRILSWFDFEWRLWRLPKDQFARPDAVIVSSLSLLTILNGLLLRRRYGCRLIFEVRDIWPLTIIETGGYSRYNPFVFALALVERLAYRKADVIVGTMPNLGQHVEEVLGYSRPVACVPMGVDEELVGKGDPLPPDYDAYIPENKFIVCHAGTIGIDNALDPLFDCARALRDRPDIHFLIVGRGGLKAHYEVACSDLPNVSFPPAVPKGMVQSVLARCDLLYFSTHVSKVWKYGQSLNKVIDYMLAGKPIVASYSGFPSMIDESGGGSFVPAGDVNALKEEILRYAAMPQRERGEMGAAGRHWLLRNRRYADLADDYLKLAVPEAA